VTESAKIADRVLAIFRELPNRPILGSILGLQIKTHFPDFDPAAYGCRNLRHFLQLHLSQIEETGRRGQDVEYALKPAGSTVQPSPVYDAAEAPKAGTTVAPTPPIRHDLWKTFVSPSGAYQMYVDPNQHNFQILRRGETAPLAPWVKVSPCPEEVHIDIAREFLQHVSDPEHRRELESVLGSGIWWVEFLRITRLRGLDKDWVKFRRLRLSQELERTLSAIGVPFSAAAEAWPRATLRTPMRMPLPDEQMRSALQRAVGRLSQEELRRIWLPVGIVIDELHNR
jgi:hypothetical protein